MLFGVLMTTTVVFSQTTINSGNASGIAAMMSPGWNLGNTLEAPGGETAWQKTKTTQKLIDFIKSQGFRSVRIPCSWDVHSDADGKIDSAWIARVKEIVRYCINDSLYVLLNDHWDNGWIEVKGFTSSIDDFQPVTENIITSKIIRLTNLWTQIANAFSEFDNHLLFAGLNEPFQDYRLFHGRHQQLTPILMRYNQTFVNAVRSTGGNNVKRILVVQAPATNIDSATKSEVGFTMPNDVAGANNLMLEVHYYDPWNFCGESNEAKWFWGSHNHIAGDTHNCNWGEQQDMERLMEALETKFVSKGYPVIIGEYGACWRQLPQYQRQHDQSIRDWYREQNKRAVSHGCVPMVWDVNVPDRHGEQGVFTLIDREQLTIFNAHAMKGILDGIAEGTAKR